MGYYCRILDCYDWIRNIMAQKTKSRAVPAILIIAAVYATVMFGGKMWKNLNMNEYTPRVPSSEKPAEDKPKDLLLLDVIWTKHADHGIGLATFELPTGPESEELVLREGGEALRSVPNPLAQGIAEYAVQTWQPTKGLMQCTIKYVASDGKMYQVAYAHTNYGGEKSNVIANILCSTTPADIKAAVAKGKGK